MRLQGLALLLALAACGTSTEPSNQPPVALFSVQCHPSEQFVQPSCEFFSQASDPDGFIVEHHWDFGDGSRMDYAAVPLVPVRRYYGVGGTFTVTLWVVDNAGAESSASREVVVH